MLGEVRRRAPAARVDGVLVQPMIADGTEMIVGVKTDPVLGPAVACGFGGVLVEVMRDVAVRVPPFDDDEAREMIAELRGAALLRGVRSRPAADVAALVDVLLKVGALALAHRARLRALDLNPLVVREAGAGAVAVDWRIELASWGNGMAPPVCARAGTATPGLPGRTGARLSATSGPALEDPRPDLMRRGAARAGRAVARRGAPTRPGRRSMAYDTALYEAAGPVATITLKRPETLNAINPQPCAHLRPRRGWVPDGREARAGASTGIRRAAHPNSSDATWARHPVSPRCRRRRATPWSSRAASGGPPRDGPDEGPAPSAARGHSSGDAVLMTT